MEKELITYRSFLLTILLCIVSLGFSAQEETKKVLIKDLSNDFFTISKGEHKAMPLLQHQTSKKVYLFLNVEEHKDELLRFNADRGLSLYANNKLVFLAEVSEEVLLPINEISDIVSGEVTLTFYNPYLKFNPSSARVVREEKVTEQSSDEYKLIPRIITENSITAVSLLLIVGLIGFIKNTNTVIWSGYFSFKKVLALKAGKEEYVLKGVFSTESLILFVLVSLLGALLLYEWQVSIFKIELSNTITFVSSFFAILGVLFLKFYLLKIITLFLNVSSFGNQQFFDFIRFTIWYSIVFLAITLAIGVDSSGYSTVLLWIGLCIWTIRVMLMAMMRLKFQKIYLFSYLCASEIIPAVVLINFLGTIN